jgi:glucose-6-phosphate isomerase
MLNLQTYIKISPSVQPDHIQKAMDSVLGSKNIGFIDLPNRNHLWTESEKIGSEIRKNYDHLIVVGIGGSSMGPRALAEYSGQTNISFLDNVDSIETENVLHKITSNETLAWLFISKSGSTIEVLWTIELISQRYTELGKKLWPHTYFITEHTDNSLHNLSKQYSRPCLEIPLDVGGRFSVLSPVGLVVGSYLDLDLDLLKSGSLLALNDKKNIQIMIEQFLSSFERNESITLFWFYCSRLRWFGGWLQQLWAESLGKKTDRNGSPAFPFSTPMTSIGACDQHSILQQVVDGPKNKFVCVFRFKDIENHSTTIKKPVFTETKSMQGKRFGDLLKAEALATQKALDLSNVSTMLYEFDHLNPETLGYLFMSYQIVVSVLAEIKNVNAFDQPGVALGKSLIQDYI